MPGLVPGIHVFGRHAKKRNKTWMAGTRPGMTSAISYWSPPMKPAIFQSAPSLM
jgi:hypothetical protein